MFLINAQANWATNKENLTKIGKNLQIWGWSSQKMKIFLHKNSKNCRKTYFLLGIKNCRTVHT